MRLPDSTLDLSAQLAEFDVWITPSLGEIRDTEKFKEELERIVVIFDALCVATSNFAEVASCDADAIASCIVAVISPLDLASSLTTLQSLASVLFLVTGKSDNNAKCQFPLYLRDRAQWKSIPALVRQRGTTVPRLTELPVPRELKADKYMGFVASWKEHADLQAKLLTEFVRFVLSDKEYATQLWSIGRSYAMLKPTEHERALLSPLVVFQVRGSVAASGGHDPEGLLRASMDAWGLVRDVDYNIADAVIDTSSRTPVEGDASAKVKSKTRAYDFTLPYRTKSWTPCIFVQCQFYAGDSGSVSHKNVDQTTASRATIAPVIPNARFVEYVDGAGYFASLNGDLKSLLSMASTRSFFQVRSAAIRLRRELQSVGYLTLLEIEHAVLAKDGKVSSVKRLLRRDGYAPAEIERAVGEAVARSVIGTNGATLTIDPTRRAISRRHLLLDVAAAQGKTIKAGGSLKGLALVPGYGPFHGLPLDELAKQALSAAPTLASDWSSPDVILGDIRWLQEQGMMMVG